MYEQLSIFQIYKCRRCQRKLKDIKSINLGFGETCYKKYVAAQKNSLFNMKGDN